MERIHFQSEWNAPSPNLLSNVGAEVLEEVVAVGGLESLEHCPT
jgi:hypothetical protein